MNRRYLHRDLPPTPGMGAIKVEPPKPPLCPKEMYSGIYETIPAVGEGRRKSEPPPIPMRSLTTHLSTGSSTRTSSSSSLTDELHQDLICNEDGMPVYPPLHQSPHHSPRHMPYNVSPGKSNQYSPAQQPNRPFSYAAELLKSPHFQRQNEQYDSQASDAAYEPIPGDPEYAYSKSITRVNGHGMPSSQGNVQYRQDHTGRNFPVHAQKAQPMVRPPPPINPPPKTQGGQSPKLQRQSPSQISEVPPCLRSPVLQTKTLKPVPVSVPVPPTNVPANTPKPLQQVKPPDQNFPAPPPPVPIHVDIAAKMAKNRSPSPPLPPLPPDLYHDHVPPPGPAAAPLTQNVVPPPPPPISSLPPHPQFRNEQTNVVQGRAVNPVTLPGGRNSPKREQSPRRSFDPVEPDRNIGGLAADISKIKLKKRDQEPSPPVNQAPTGSNPPLNDVLNVRLKPTLGTKVDIYGKAPEQGMSDFDPPLPPPPPPVDDIPQSSSVPDVIPVNTKPTAVIPPTTVTEPFRKEPGKQKGGAKGNSTMDLNIDDIDLNQVPGYAPIPDTCPNWKRDMYERKNREKVEAYIDGLKREKEEAEKWKDIPAWKRRILKEKARKDDDVKPAVNIKAPEAKVEKPKVEVRMEEEPEMEDEDLADLPPWKAELLRKRGGAAPKNWGDEREDANKEVEEN